MQGGQPAPSPELVREAPGLGWGWMATLKLAASIRCAPAGWLQPTCFPEQQQHQQVFQALPQREAHAQACAHAGQCHDCLLKCSRIRSNDGPSAPRPPSEVSPCPLPPCPPPVTCPDSPPQKRPCLALPQLSTCLGAPLPSRGSLASLDDLGTAHRAQWRFPQPSRGSLEPESELAPFAQGLLRSSSYASLASEAVHILLGQSSPGDLLVPGAPGAACLWQPREPCTPHAQAQAKENSPVAGAGFPSEGGKANAQGGEDPFVGDAIAELLRKHFPEVGTFLGAVIREKLTKGMARSPGAWPGWGSPAAAQEREQHQLRQIQNFLWDLHCADANQREGRSGPPSDVCAGTSAPAESCCSKAVRGTKRGRNTTCDDAAST